MPRYSWILFDLDGTLLDFDAAQAESIRRTMAALGHEIGTPELDTFRRINLRVWEQLERNEIDRAALGATRFAQFFAEIGGTADVEAANRAYLKSLSQHSGLLPGARPLLDALLAHVRGVIITNGLASVARPRMVSSGLADEMHAMVISEEIGAAKPDPRIFDAAFEAMGRPQRAEVLIVGDSLSADIAGGLGYGIDACWFNASGRPNPGGARPTYEINELGELCGIVGVE